MNIVAALAQVAFIGAAAAGVYGFVHAAQNDSRRTSCTAVCALRPAYAGNDRTAPDFELADMDGAKVKLSSYRGKTVVLNFWTKTCKPCLEEMPQLADLARMLKARSDIVVLAVSIDEGPEAVRDTLQVALNGDVPFRVLFDPESETVGDRYGTTLFPETWIIDPQGVIRARFDGVRDWSSSLAVEVTEKVAAGAACPVEFERSEPKGVFAGLCNDDS